MYNIIAQDRSALNNHPNQHHLRQIRRHVWHLVTSHKPVRQFESENIHLVLPALSRLFYHTQLFRNEVFQWLRRPLCCQNDRASYSVSRARMVALRVLR